MRLPTDATLLIGVDADPQLEQVWREEHLPVVPIAAALDQLEAELEAIGTATVVACGVDGAEAATLAASLGFRTFLVGETEAPQGVRLVSINEAIDAGRTARARERWKAARR